MIVKIMGDYSSTGIWNSKGEMLELNELDVNNKLPSHAKKIIKEWAKEWDNIFMKTFKPYFYEFKDDKLKGVLLKKYELMFYSKKDTKENYKKQLKVAYLLNKYLPENQYYIFIDKELVKYKTNRKYLYKYNQNLYSYFIKM